MLGKSHWLRGNNTNIPTNFFSLCGLSCRGGGESRVQKILYYNYFFITVIYAERLFSTQWTKKTKSPISYTTPRNKRWQPGPLYCCLMRLAKVTLLFFPQLRCKGHLQMWRTFPGTLSNCKWECSSRAKSSLYYQINKQALFHICSPLFLGGPI